MKNTFNLIIASLMIFIIGCDFNPTSASEQISYSDSEIIGMIKNAEKIEISFDELPSQSRDIVQNENIDYESFKNWRASGIGYLAELSGRGQNVGNFREVYFDMDGKKLEHINSEDEERPEGDGDSEDEERPEGDGTDVECFELILPVTYAMPDGSTITIETEESWSLLRSWYDSNPESEEEPALVFPISVTYGADSTGTINNQEELEDAYSTCRDEEDEDRPEGDGDSEDEERPEGDGTDVECFELILPVTYAMPDGSTITIETEESWSLLRSWYDSNPESEEEPALVFPISVTYGADSTGTINNQEELEDAYSTCRDEEDEDRPEGDEEDSCGAIILPVTYTMPDGSTITVEDDSGYGLLREWTENNPEIDGEPSIQYPFDVLYIVEDQEVTVTVNSNEEYMDSQTEYCSSDRD